MTLRSTIKDYSDISKPRIMVLLLVVAWAAMFVAKTGFPPLIPFLAVTAGGIFATASSGAWNHLIEKNRDAQMGRTQSRPIVQGRITPVQAAIYASVTGIIGVGVLIPVSLLAAALNAIAIVFYVIIYTVVLKPSTPQNIVWGGFAGSFPALIGWAAVSPSLSAAAWVLALIVFFWTPPHFWALALLYQEDYEAANYPMMPNVKGVPSTKKQIFAYAFLTFVASMALIFTASIGYFYVIAAAILGTLLLCKCEKILRSNNRKAYRSLFLFTIQYLGYLLIALMIDQVLVGHWSALQLPMILSG